MKRYLIFGAIGPLVGGFLMLFATTVDSGYWTETSWSEIGKFLGAFVRTLQYSYLFGIVTFSITSSALRRWRGC